MRDFFFEPLGRLACYRELLEAANAGVLTAAYGMVTGQKHHLAAALVRDTQRPLLYITANESQAARCFDDMTQFLESGVYLLTPRETTLYHASAASRETAARRVETLYAAAMGKARVIIAPAEALQQRLMPVSGFRARVISIAVGDIVEPRAFIDKLVAAGYERVERVDIKGQFAARGGILDVFPPDSPQALRLEWFDDEIDSIRLFDVASQRSSENVQQAELPPAAELLVMDAAQAEAAADRLQAALDEALSHSGHAQMETSAQSDGDWDTLPDFDQISEKSRMQLRPGSQEDKLAARMQRYIDSLRQGTGFSGMETLVNLLYSGTQTAMDWLHAPLLIFDEPDKLQNAIDNTQLEYIEMFKGALERGEAIPAQSDLLYPAETLLSGLAASGAVLFASFLRTMAGLSPKKLLQIDGGAVTAYQSQLKELAHDIGDFRKEGYRVLLLSGGVSRGERLLSSLAEFAISSSLADETLGAQEPGDVSIMPLSLTSGFLYPEIKFAVISDGDIYGAAYQKRRAKRNVGERIAAFTDLSVGDYVVHESHGVGIYKGTVRLQSEGLWRDYLFIQYLGNDKLYVPTDQMDRVQRFIGAENSQPRINKLGGNDWQKQKQRVKQSIRTMAFDLVKLYAARQEKRGYAFAKDSPWQRQFEDNFPFEETPDQLSAIADIKADMESARVMDRLLCGDVGYGKTEVALRAVFKAAVDGKQVALLVPTTILAQQHYNTIQKRFEGFPIRVEMLSRFRTSMEQADIKKRLKAGELDIVVGTHKLLGKTIQFRDLGLLVVDEEQRFGVQHKETIKNLRKDVDVLTLSATPIPRTLHMSMVGIRDMSLLETPPEERYPVQTYVVEYSDGLVRDAVMREIARGGQAYILYNRVDRIDRFYEKLRQLVPEARIAIGHGQMRETRLEDVMLDFYEGRYDVLLCTTIIESGLDIPNCNTMIVCEADHFGLSQLYQLRGRVGRSNRLAYAYLTIPPNRMLSETAEKRLSAIREFTMFGSGFRIAMRDLEIRGAGNLLGAEQHGFLSSVGYDMYCKLMEETVREIRGEMGDITAIETRVDYPVDAYLPAEYVPSDAQRIELYKRIASTTDRDMVDDLIEEITDRYGDPPAQVSLLLDIALLKSYCNRLGIDSIGYEKGQVNMQFAKGITPDIGRLFAAVHASDDRLVFSARAPVSLVLRVPYMPAEEMLREALYAMERVTEAMAQTAEEETVEEVTASGGKRDDPF